MSQEKFTLFWRGPFSQWATSPFSVDGVGYSCAEQYMMAEKARMFGDRESLDAIMATKSPREMKKLGRGVKGFDKEVWEQTARKVVYDGSYAKYRQNLDLCRLLLDTEGTTLVEASPYDRIWGIGLSEDDPRALNRDQWDGLNWLGDALTRVRNNIQEEIKLYNDHNCEFWTESLRSSVEDSIKCLTDLGFTITPPDAFKVPCPVCRDYEWTTRIPR